MYKAFLSYAQLREYLSVLIENNLIEYVEGSQTYKATEKGLNFLKMHNEIGELLSSPRTSVAGGCMLMGCLSCPRAMSFILNCS
ncbi:MAG: winged helix-turn-helix domain-containing protein [Salinimicrobium sediminis]|nr:winged helix-turn-helix domain-containing protein [Salinimicrobium sediminis]